MTNRTTANDIAKSLGGIISADTLRNWVDEGVLPAERDFRGWRWFPKPEETIQRVQDLIYGKVVDKGSESER
ncbi:hypothetical protein H8E77_40715 [bacterium]|nr:hypothetical protein [bacterium]